MIVGLIAEVLKVAYKLVPIAYKLVPTVLILPVIDRQLSYLSDG